MSTIPAAPPLPLRIHGRRRKITPNAADNHMHFVEHPQPHLIDLTLEEEGEDGEDERRRAHPMFFKVFFSDQCSRHLDVPRGFHKHLEGRGAGTCTMEGPSGNQWCVELSRGDGNGGFFFGVGWEDLVKDHDLQTGEFLVFEYRGESRFGVKIFDRSTCEKESALTARPSRTGGCVDAGKKRERRRRRTREECDGGAVRKKRKLNVAPVEIRRPRTRLSGVNRPSVVGGVLPRISGEHMPMPRQQEEKKEIHSTNHGTISFRSRYPFFLHMITKSDISRHKLHVPKSVAHYLPEEATDIVMWMLNGRQFVVRGIGTHEAYNLSSGWRIFCKETDLDVGDVCIFELVKKYVFRVYIQRLGRIPTLVVPWLRKSGKTCSVVMKKRGRKKKCGNDLQIPAVSSEDLDAPIRNVSKRTSLNDSCVERSPKRMLSSAHKAIIPPSIVRRNSRGEKKDIGPAYREANSFCSDNPFFMSIMKRTLLLGRKLYIQMSFASLHLPNKPTKAVLRISDGRRFPVQCSCYKNAHHFQGGWSMFVNGNDLKPGDVCVFEMVRKFVFDVHIYRVGRRELG